MWTTLFLEVDPCRFSLNPCCDEAQTGYSMAKAKVSAQKAEAVSSARELKNEFVVDALVKLLHVPESDVNWILLGTKGVTDAEVDEEAALDKCTQMLLSQPAMQAMTKSMICKSDTDTTDTDSTTTEGASEFWDDDPDIEFEKDRLSQSGSFATATSDCCS